MDKTALDTILTLPKPRSEADLPLIFPLPCLFIVGVGFIRPAPPYPLNAVGV